MQSRETKTDQKLAEHPSLQETKGLPHSPFAWFGAQANPLDVYQIRKIANDPAWDAGKQLTVEARTPHSGRTFTFVGKRVRRQKWTLVANRGLRPADWAQQLLEALDYIGMRGIVTSRLNRHDAKLLYAKAINPSVTLSDLAAEVKSSPARIRQRLDRAVRTCLLVISIAEPATRIRFQRHVSWLHLELDWDEVYDFR